MKKLIALLLSFLIIVLPVAAMANTTDTSIISLYELKLLTSDFVLTNINNTEQCTWNTDMAAKETPLYDFDSKIVAYYVALFNADNSPNGYIVVNASVQNPIVLEYAFDTGHKEINNTGKVYYATSGAFFSESSVQKRLISSRDNSSIVIDDGTSEKMRDLWSDMNCENIPAKAHLQSLKNSIVNSEKNITTREGADWGMITTLPYSSWEDQDSLLNYASGAPYYRTYDFSGSNHCGAVAALNVLKYYQTRLGSTLIKPNVNTAFNYLYQNTGNGSLTTPSNMQSALNSYIADRKSSGYLSSNIGISILPYYVNHFSRIKSCINGGKMPLLYIWKDNAFMQAHWINILAYYLHSNGTCYIRILNQWDSDVNHYYLLKTSTGTNSNLGYIVSVQITD